MNDQINQRLAALRQEYATGEKMLADLRNKQRELEGTLMRIAGAIQVLEELLAESESSDAAGEAS